MGNHQSTFRGDHPSIARGDHPSIARRDHQSTAREDHQPTIRDEYQSTGRRDHQSSAREDDQSAVPALAPTHVQTGTSLENLPAELRIQILLELVDFASLRSLVRASPSFHASYRVAGRQKVLTQVAWKQLDPRLRVDALAAVHSKRFYDNVYSHDGHAKRTADFIDDYSRAREHGHLPHLGWLSPNTMAEVVDLIHLQEAIKQVAAEYCLSIASKTGRNQESLVLSQMEELRLHRALYRFQLYCNFFGENPHLPSYDRYAQYRVHPLPRFLPSFPPWETVEIACIWHYLMKRWAPLLRETGGVKYTTKARPTNDSDVEDECGRLDIDGRDDSQYRSGFDWRLARERRDYLVHQGPLFLAQVLANKTLQGRRAAVDSRPSESLLEPFCCRYSPIPLGGFLPPAAKLLHHPDLFAYLSQLPECEQPSHAWQWFCHRFHVDSLGLSPDAVRENTWEVIRHNCGAHQLGLGLPFWDEETMQDLAPIFDEEEDSQKGTEKFKSLADIVTVENAAQKETD